MTEYVVSCNPERFDILKHLETSKTIWWKQRKPCKIGDIVYMYLGRPYSRLFYSFEVIETDALSPTDMPNFYRNSPKKNDKYMCLKLLEGLPSQDLSLDDLLSHGLKTVQCSTEVSAQLHNYIVQVCDKSRV